LKEEPIEDALAVASAAAKGLFDDWCSSEQLGDGPCRVVRVAEKAGGRVAVRTRLCEVVRSHYNDPRNITDDIAELDYNGAAEILRQQLPESATAHSGELGEIIATEFVEAHSDYRVPVRRLRFKDGREMALRGDDLIGVRIDEHLHYLKGEVKSLRR
jgi:Cap4 SAVED domain